MSLGRLLWRGLVTALLVGALGVAAALMFAPELLAPVENALVPVYDAVEENGSDQLLRWAVGLIVGMVTLVVVIRNLAGGGDPAPVLVPEDRRPPESTSVDPTTVSGYATDDAIDRIESLEEARDRRDDLRAVAVAALRTAGESPEDARRRLNRGAWTDDDLAAGFLGETVPVPLLARLRGWLDGASEGRRRLVRSIDAIETLAVSPDRVVRTSVDGGEANDE